MFKPASGRRRPSLLAILLAVLIAVSGTLAACKPASPTFGYQSDADLRSLTQQAAPALPAATLAVLSDLHLYDLSLGTTGQAFDDYLANDRKLLRESNELLDAAVSAILKEPAGIVLVTGDLTKDGEASSHALAVRYLQRLRAAGKQVFVVPGNHDVLNGLSERYGGDTAERVPNVTPDEFARLYADFGFNQALLRDPGSLSYVAEPVPGMWLLALDACRYRDNREGHEETVGGKFRPATLQWIEQALARAAREHKAVIAMMHHGVLEHFASQAQNDPDYVVADYPAVSRMLAEYNVRLVFTGHYHAQDITFKRWPDGKFLFDVETGSLGGYPNPYRVVTIGADQQMAIVSHEITSIPSHPSDLPDYAAAYLHEGVAGIADKAIRGYHVGADEAKALAQQVAGAYAAHYAGDETLAPGQPAVNTHGLSLLGWAVVTFRRSLLEGLWHDLPPADNNVTIDLSTGDAS